MRTTTKLTLLVIVTVGMLTAVAMSTITSGGNLAYAKKKSCNETEEIICQTKTQSLSNEKYLLSNANETATRSDHGENDSNIVDEQIRVDDSEIQVDNNSTSTTTVLPSIPQPEDSPFSLPTM